MADQTILQIASADGRFGTLAAAVEAAGLVDTLNGEGPFTVFAPTDEAFGELLEDLEMSAEELLAETDLLQAVLTYHVVAGKVMAADVMNLTTANTVQGEDIEIYVEDDSVLLNDEAEVIQADIEASNGVIHVIDVVILPPSMLEEMDDEDEEEMEDEEA